MGQRLNIEIKSGEEIIANAYYHWGAYSESAYKLAEIIVDEFDNVKDLDKFGQAIALLQKTGAGVVNEDFDAVKSKLPEDFQLEKAISRNLGLTSISEEGMKETRDWEEGRVTVDIDNQKIDFDVFWKLDDVEDTGLLSRMENAKQLDFNPFDMNFEDIEKLGLVVSPPGEVFMIDEMCYQCIY